MAYTIKLTEEAVQDLRRLPAFHRAAVRDAIEAHLRHEPNLSSKSRIKRLRGSTRAQFRLRVGEMRVFYRIEDKDVIVLGVVPKSEQNPWLRNQHDDNNQ